MGLGENWVRRLWWSIIINILFWYEKNLYLLFIYDHLNIGTWTAYKIKQKNDYYPWITWTVQFLFEMENRVQFLLKFCYRLSMTKALTQSYEVNFIFSRKNVLEHLKYKSNIIRSIITIITLKFWANSTINFQYYSIFQRDIRRFMKKTFFSMKNTQN